ncbi:MAG: hypothetical protein GSR81_02870 [Desulfurococcales archaeon]|nr:hypothetical protein [Desulfurococcales archaeon]
MYSNVELVGFYALLLLLTVIFSLALARKGSHVKSNLDEVNRVNNTPQLIPVVPKEIYVFKRHGDMLLPLKAKISNDGRMLFTKNGEAYIIPEGYKPKIYLRKKWRGYKTILVFLADSDGNLVSWEKDKIQPNIPDPVFINRVVNSRIIEKLAGATMIRATDIISWLLAGLGLAFILVFIVFPILGIDVSIGHIQVNVPPPQVVIQHAQQTPPPGNYTINP